MSNKKQNQSFSYSQSEKTGHYIAVRVEEATKIPLYSGWQHYKPLSPHVIVKNNYQVGFALGTDVLVIDMDVYKWKGKKSAKLLVCRYPELKHAARVKTMRGGYHLFLKYGGNSLLLAKTLKDYPGIDFLRQGMFVMCAGNPNYKWVKRVDNWDALPLLPSGLVKELGSPKSEIFGAGDVNHTVIHADQLEELLEGIDPYLFNGAKHPKGKGKYDWQDFMMSCAAAVGYGNNADGFIVFDSWCRQVSYYKNQGCSRARWSSIKFRNGGITIASLYRTCKTEGVDWKGICGLEVIRDEAAEAAEAEQWQTLLGEDDGEADVSREDFPEKTIEKPSKISMLESIDDILMEPREDHEVLLKMLSESKGGSLQSIKSKVYKMVFIGSDNDMKIKLSDNQIAETCTVKSCLLSKK